MPRLTEQEQQEIVRFIEADRPLPDKYRFLLFEDKREVELVWNGKTSEVCNIVLPFQVIEQVDEPLKMAQLRQWCEDINRVQTDVEYDFVYVDEESFEKYKPTSFRQLLEAFKEYKEKI